MLFNKLLGATDSTAAVEIIDSAVGTISGGSVAVPAHAADDVILVMTMGAENSLTVPVLISGYTSITTSSYDYVFGDTSMRLQFIVDTDNSITTVAYPGYVCSLLILRNVTSFPVVAVKKGSFSSPSPDATPPLPAASGLTPNKGRAIIAGTVRALAQPTSVAAPFTGFETPSTMGHIVNHKLTSISEASSITYDAAVFPFTWIVEAAQ